MKLCIQKCLNLEILHIYFENIAEKFSFMCISSQKRKKQRFLEFLGVQWSGGCAWMPRMWSLTNGARPWPYSPAQRWVRLSAVPWCSNTFFHDYSVFYFNQFLKMFSEQACLKPAANFFQLLQLYQYRTSFVRLRNPSRWKSRFFAVKLWIRTQISANFPFQHVCPLGFYSSLPLVVYTTVVYRYLVKSVT